jgi:hypothetical protein
VKLPTEDQKKLLGKLSKAHEKMLKRNEEYEKAIAERAAIVLECDAADVGPSAMGRALGLTTARMGALLSSAKNKAKEDAAS